MIFFLSLTEYPTKKAYGVTLSGTYVAAIKSGFDAKIIAPNSYQASRRGARLVLTCMRTLRKLYGGVPTIISKVAFAAHRIFFFQFIKLEFDQDLSDAFWIRDLDLARFLSRHFPFCRVVLEIHQLQSDRALRQLRYLPNNVTLGPISEAVFNQLVGLRGSKNIVRLPMGVSSYFFSSDHQNQTIPEYDIGYFGSYKSSGHDQGIDSVLFQLIPRLKTNANFRILFAGLGVAGVSALNDIASKAGVENQIRLLEYIEHKLVPEEMKKCKTLLLPYPEGEYFESRFPIKALEYGAVRRPILCSRTKSHTYLFTDENVWFYEYGDPEGILNVFDMVEGNQSTAMRKIQTTFNLALNYTYPNRIDIVKEYIS
jgi:glycosyltransferase involved in cell wall biosynthesis